MDTDRSALPLIDDVTVKDTFADFCTGLNFAHGNLHMTFASVTADHSADQAPTRRIVSARIVMPITGAIELRDLLTQLIDALTAQGVIVPETSSPTMVMPPGRPH
jgi:ABC-type transporter lipoprotein component MlaA